MRVWTVRWPVLLTAVCLCLVRPVAASEVRFFTMSTRDAFLEGELTGVSVDSLGVLRLAQQVARVGEVDEPFLFAASAHPEGWVLATGNSGRLLLLSPDGSVTTLLEAEEPTLFATAVDGSGVVWAGSSPGGKLYKLGAEGPEVVYETGDTYIWAIEPDGGGGAWVGTGTEGRIHKWDGDGGRVVFDADDVHARALHALPDGQVLVGTASEGLILLLGADGTARTLYDSGLAEVVAFESGENGSCYAAVIQSEAGFIDMSPRQGNGQNGSGSATVNVAEEAAQMPRPVVPSNGLRSQVLRFPCTGGVVETVRSFQEETVYDLLWLDGRLWIGTGQEGKVFSLQDGDVVLEKDVSERQVVGLMPDEHGPALATTNSAAVYRVLAEPERSGTYTSPALDAGEIAEFGTLHWRGDRGGAGSVRFSFRSGMSGVPDRTWSSWSASAAGAEIRLDSVPPGRYLQFRAELASASPSPSVSQVTVSYRQKNLAPALTSLSVLDAGHVLVPANFNPTSQVFEPVSPNREGIFTTLTPEVERDNQRLKTLWKRGYRTLQWEAEDPNGDQLRYRLEFRPDAQEGGGWFSIVEDLSETYLSFDATVLPDGVYRFRVTASDAAGNGNGEALVTERISGPVAIDHAPPVLGKVVRDGSTLRFEVRDALNALRRAEYSLDGQRWSPVEPDDGLLDGRTESFTIEVDPDVRLVLLRAMDAFFNLASFDLSTEP